MAYSPDGKHLLVASGNWPTYVSGIHMIDEERGDAIRLAPPEGVRRMASKGFSFSHGGRCVVYEYEGSLIVVDSDTAQTLAEVQIPEELEKLVIPDFGTHAVTTHDDGRQVYVWDLSGI